MICTVTVGQGVLLLISFDHLHFLDAVEWQIRDGIVVQSLAGVAREWKRRGSIGLENETRPKNLQRPSPPSPNLMVARSSESVVQQPSRRAERCARRIASQRCLMTTPVMITIPRPDTQCFTE